MFSRLLIRELINWGGSSSEVGLWQNRRHLEFIVPGKWNSPLMLCSPAKMSPLPLGDSTLVYERRWKCVHPTIPLYRKWGSLGATYLRHIPLQIDRHSSFSVVYKFTTPPPHNDALVGAKLHIYRQEYSCFKLFLISFFNCCTPPLRGRACND